MVKKLGLFMSISKAFESSLGFKLDDLTSWPRFVTLMFRPTDASSLAAIRIMFGASMLVDIMDERGLSVADVLWGDPNQCQFPLFSWLRPLSLEWMCMVYVIMWIGALGVMLGAHFRFSCLAFCIPYWYLFLLDKTSWNNHSYLYGLLSLIFLFSSGNHMWSLDCRYNRVKQEGTVPLWNYGVFRFQLFILYFLAGLKKLDLEWLEGHSMSSLSYHWVFSPMRLFLTPEQVDLWIIHVFGFLLDLTIGFWMLFDSTRPVAMIFLTSFHLMNAQMFRIGMFPYVCLVTMPIFCNTDWPRKLFRKFYLGSFKEQSAESAKTSNKVISEEKKFEQTEKARSLNITFKHHLTVSLLLLHGLLQVFLPYSHFLTKGYNNWTNGLYGYSWDMMVHSWDTVLILVKVVNKDTGKEVFIDPEAWVHTDNWSKHADMVVQYAQCVKRNVQNKHKEFKNISVYIDVWTSLNGRVQQRMFDPRVDLLGVSWSPFETVPWVLPLLKQFTPFRNQLKKLREDVHTWSNNSQAVFIADFPGLHFKNYMHEGLRNISLTVFEGEVILETEGNPNRTLGAGQVGNVPSGLGFHRVHTVSPSPSCYMYAYSNLEGPRPKKHRKRGSLMARFWVGLRRRLRGLLTALALVNQAFLKILYSVPMVRRVKVVEPLIF